MQKNQSQVCQWCMSEIIWDEEIGPETHCPHCDSELGGYRTVSVGLNKEEDNKQLDEDNWLDDEKSSEAGWMLEEEGYRGGTRSMLAAEDVIRRIIDEQHEVPECPACREYMLEAGEQLIGGESFKQTESPAIGVSFLPNPFKLTWYVCPACYHTASFLSQHDRAEMVNRLASRF